MLLKSIKIHKEYDEDKDEILKIMQLDKGLSYEEARIQHASNLRKNRDYKLNRESRCIISFFQKELGDYHNDNCGQLCIDCSKSNENRIVYLGKPMGIIKYNFNYDEYLKLDDIGKKKAILNIIKEVFEMINKEYNWDLEQVYSAIKEIENKNYIHKGQFLKSKMNRSRAYTAKLLYEQGINTIEFYLSITDKVGNEIRCIKVLEEISDEFYYGKHLGNIKWISNDEVVLLNAEGEIYWRENISDIGNNKNIEEIQTNISEIEDIDEIEIKNSSEKQNSKTEDLILDKYEDEFWKIISMFDWRHEGNDEKVLKPAIKYLAKKSNEDIYMFYEFLSKLLYDIDGIEYAKNIGEDSYVNDVKYFSTDEFLYARCVVVANGKEYYYNILNNPENMPKDLEFESILYIADETYELKNDEQFDYETKYSYETFSNQLKWHRE